MFGIFLLMISAAAWIAILCRVVFLMKEHNEFYSLSWYERLVFTDEAILEFQRKLENDMIFGRFAFINNPSMQYGDAIGIDPGAPGGDQTVMYRVRTGGGIKPPEALPLLAIPRNDKEESRVDWGDMERVLDVMPTKENKEDDDR